MHKTHINLTISVRVLEMLNQAKLLNNGVSLSELVEYAIQNTYRNQEDVIKEKMRHHQSEFMRWKDKLSSISSISQSSKKLIKTEVKE